MSNYRIAVVGERDLIMGFRGLGIDLAPVRSKAETEAALKRISGEPDMALILITETVTSYCPDMISDLRNKTDAALLIIPSHEGSRHLSMTEMRKEIERAVGINILDKRKEI